MTHWTLDDLAREFGLSRRTIQTRKLPEWEAKGFPAPLPWCRRQRRYDPAAVLAWKARQERAARAAPPVELRLAGR